MRIVLIGCVQFSESALKKLVSISANVVGVCTKQSSKFNSDHVDLSAICKKNDIPFIYAKNINDESVISWVQDLSPDVIYCFGWSSLLKKPILDIPKYGSIGFHPAKLPHNRGRHPLIWALVLGLKETATSFFFMDEKADTGKIIAQKVIAIDENDDATTLYQKVTAQALSQIEEFTYSLDKNNGEIEYQEQSIEEGNSWRKRSAADGVIDFRMSAKAIVNLVRGLTKPYVGAHLVWNQNEIKVWAAEVYACDESNLEPGKVLKSDLNAVIVKTYDSAVAITDHGFNELPKQGEYIK